VQWSLDGTLLPTDTLKSIKPQQSGVYSVNIQVRTCVASAMVTYQMPEVVTGVPEATSSTLQVYPNPVHGYLYFESQDTAVRHVSVQNASGQTVGSVQLRQGTGKFDMSLLSSGLYLIQIQDSKGAQEIKIIKD